MRHFHWGLAILSYLFLIKKIRFFISKRSILLYCKWFPFFAYNFIFIIRGQELLALVPQHLYRLFWEIRYKWIKGFIILLGHNLVLMMRLSFINKFINPRPVPFKFKLILVLHFPLNLVQELIAVLTCICMHHHFFSCWVWR